MSALNLVFTDYPQACGYQKVLNANVNGAIRGIGKANAKVLVLSLNASSNSGPVDFTAKTYSRTSGDQLMMTVTATTASCQENQSPLDGEPQLTITQIDAAHVAGHIDLSGGQDTASGDFDFQFCGDGTAQTVNMCCLP